MDGEDFMHGEREKETSVLEACEPRLAHWIRLAGPRLRGIMGGRWAHLPTYDHRRPSLQWTGLGVSVTELVGPDCLSAVWPVAVGPPFTSRYLRKIRRAAANFKCVSIFVALNQWSSVSRSWSWSALNFSPRV
ncbi:hypothetical protein H6P81_018822 [Aristolochia fimbriata]|uniref:Uncharacterized protein n=1 Tax=Aristolochia fimbriata TaxID=158543 RepID=A0AAV7E6H1_ARIFI|nr:hypothetical protein H6P81_018822 [Aristolochia fimbriata]